MWDMNKNLKAAGLSFKNFMTAKGEEKGKKKSTSINMLEIGANINF